MSEEDKFQQSYMDRVVTAMVVKSHGHGLFHDMTMLSILLCTYVRIAGLGSVADDLVRHFTLAMAFYHFTKLISSSEIGWC